MALKSNKIEASINQVKVSSDHQYWTFTDSFPKTRVPSLGTTFGPNRIIPGALPSEATLHYPSDDVGSVCDDVCDVTAEFTAAMKRSVFSLLVHSARAEDHTPLSAVGS